ncbi:hypothetical protein COOONC_21687 [Cooperia oncophora]
MEVNSQSLEELWCPLRLKHVILRAIIEMPLCQDRRKRDSPDDIRLISLVMVWVVCTILIVVDGAIPLAQILAGTSKNTSSLVSAGGIDWKIWSRPTNPEGTPKNADSKPPETP